VASQVLYRKIPESPNNPFPTGRHYSYDPRNENYRFNPSARGLLAKPTRSIVHRVYGGIHGVLDQSIKNLGDCTDCMLAYSTRTAPNYRTFQRIHPHVTLMDDDVEHAYEITTDIDPFPGRYKPGAPDSEDTGSDGTSACNAGIKLGWISRFEHVDPNLDSMIQAMQHYAVGLGINWYPRMFNPDGNGFVAPGPGERPAGGHELLFVGVNITGQWVKFAQSWGFDWGLDGFGYMSFPTVRRLLSEDGDIVVPIV
jgi:hypothetical protein